VEVQPVNLPLVGDKWSASRPGRFTPRKEPPGIHLIGGWMNIGAGLDAVAKRKYPFPAPAGNWNPGCPARILFTIQNVRGWTRCGHLLLTAGVGI